MEFRSLPVWSDRCSLCNVTCVYLSKDSLAIDGPMHSMERLYKRLQLTLVQFDLLPRELFAGMPETLPEALIEPI